MKNNKLLKRSYQKPSIKSEESEMNAVAKRSCHCGGGKRRGSYVQNALGLWR